MATVCSAIGDGDLYGLGVQIGLYLQWAAGFVLRNRNLWAKVSAVRVASNTISTALALTAAINTARGDAALALDYLIIYYLTIALFYAESYNLQIEDADDNNEFEEGGTGKVLRLFPDVTLNFRTFNVFNGEPVQIVLSVMNRYVLLSKRTGSRFAPIRSYRFDGLVNRYTDSALSVR